MPRRVVALVLVLLASPALGQVPSPGLPPPPTERIVMRLDFTGVPGCSDPDPFILTLTPRVHGWDPLAPDGRWRLVLTVRKQAPGYEGTAELRDPKGDVMWTTPIPPKASCFILLDRLSFKTAFRIDPPDAPPPAPPPPPPPPPPEPAMPPAPAAMASTMGVCVGTLASSATQPPPPVPLTTTRLRFIAAQQGIGRGQTGSRSPAP